MAGQFGKYGAGGGQSPAEAPESPPPAAAPPPAPAAPPTKGGKVATVALLGLGVAALASKGKDWVDARRAPSAAVTCVAAASGVDCTVVHETGPASEVCFEVEVACAGGAPAKGKGCGTVEPKGKATVAVTDLTGWAECGKPGAIQVSGVKAAKK